MFAERTSSASFLDIEWNRDALARYGLSVEAAQSVVHNAIGGENVTTTVEGRERYPVNVRYMRDFRSDTDALANVLVPASDGQRQIPLGELADVKVATGPAMIRNEDGLLTGYVFVKTAIVLLAVPFSAVGAIWCLYVLGYNMSIAVWVGVIALLGVDAQTGVFMLLYLDLASEKASREGHLRTLAELQATIVEGAAKRPRKTYQFGHGLSQGAIMWTGE